MDYWLDDVEAAMELEESPVSLDRATQACILTNLEYIMQTAANSCLLVQAYHGRLGEENMREFISSWEAAGRPAVLEFLYDVQGQCCLVFSNRWTIGFGGPDATNVFAIEARLQAWLSVGQTLSLRSWSLNDATIMRALGDCMLILEMLGAPVRARLALQELHHTTGAKVHI